MFYWTTIIRPVGTNLVLVRRVGANNLLSVKAERAKRAERLTAWGPGARSRALAGSRAEPRRGSRGAAPPDQVLGFCICKRPRKALLEIVFL